MFTIQTDNVPLAIASLVALWIIVAVMLAGAYSIVAGLSKSFARRQYKKQLQTHILQTRNYYRNGSGE